MESAQMAITVALIIFIPIAIVLIGWIFMHFFGIPEIIKDKSLKDWQKILFVIVAIPIYIIFSDLVFVAIALIIFFVFLFITKHFAKTTYNKIIIFLKTRRIVKIIGIYILLFICFALYELLA